MLNIESWGKSHVSPLSFAHHHLSYSIVSWGSVLLAEDHHAHTLSMMFLGVAVGLSTMGIEILFVSLTLGGVKRFHIPLLGVLLPSLTPIASL